MVLALIMWQDGILLLMEIRLIKIRVQIVWWELIVTQRMEQIACKIMEVNVILKQVINVPQ